jgi:hypothetical protein
MAADAYCRHRHSAGRSFRRKGVAGYPWSMYGAGYRRRPHGRPYNKPNTCAPSRKTLAAAAAVTTVPTRIHAMSSQDTPTQPLRAPDSVGAKAPAPCSDAGLEPTRGPGPSEVTPAFRPIRDMRGSLTGAVLRLLAVSVTDDIAAGYLVGAPRRRKSGPGSASAGPPSPMYAPSRSRPP